MIFTSFYDVVFFLAKFTKKKKSVFIQALQENKHLESLELCWKFVLCKIFIQLCQYFLIIFQSISRFFFLPAFMHKLYIFFNTSGNKSAVCSDNTRTDGFTSGATFRDGCSPLAGPCSLPYTLQVLHMQQIIYLQFDSSQYTAGSLLSIWLVPILFR